MAILDDVRLAIPVTTTAYDDELTDLIAAAKADLVLTSDIEGDLAVETDPLIKRAIITYCKMNFGNPTNYDKLLASYNSQKGQLASCSTYTEWGDL